MPEYVIHPILLGSKDFDKSMMTYQHCQGMPYTIPIYVWYLEGGDRKILVDTGEINPLQGEERARKLGAPVLTIDEGLARYGLTPEDVDLVIHTHLHRDHCENDYRFVNAEFIVHEKELETIRGWHPMDFRYVEDFIDEIEERGQIRPVSLEAGEELEVAPGVSVLHTPIHTPGGLSVLVETAQGVAAITGFCVIDENFSPPREIRAKDMEVIPPGTVIDPSRAYDTMLALKERAQIIIPVHERRFAQLDAIPEP